MAQDVTVVGTCVLVPLMLAVVLAISSRGRGVSAGRMRNAGAGAGDVADPHQSGGGAAVPVPCA